MPIWFGRTWFTHRTFIQWASGSVIDGSPKGTKITNFYYENIITITYFPRYGYLSIQFDSTGKCRILQIHTQSPRVCNPVDAYRTNCRFALIDPYFRLSDKRFALPIPKREMVRSIRFAHIWMVRVHRFTKTNRSDTLSPYTPPDLT